MRATRSLVRFRFRTNGSHKALTATGAGAPGKKSPSAPRGRSAMPCRRRRATWRREQSPDLAANETSAHSRRGAAPRGEPPAGSAHVPTGAAVVGSPTSPRAACGDEREGCAQGQACREEAASASRAATGGAAGAAAASRDARTARSASRASGRGARAASRTARHPASFVPAARRRRGPAAPRGRCAGRAADAAGGRCDGVWQIGAPRRASREARGAGLHRPASCGAGAARTAGAAASRSLRFRATRGRAHHAAAASLGRALRRDAELPVLRRRAGVAALSAAATSGHAPVATPEGPAGAPGITEI